MGVLEQARYFTRKVPKRKKPLTVSSKGFRVKKGTDLLSHLLRQYHRLWRA
ncbi:hypothetical protein ACR784_04000 [Sphingobacterium multivorum]|uniref:hypothetical protein n=1 Tax=Sphingobacterium multivorum TaxID=28454 RepID=UPI003DA4625A